MFKTTVVLAALAASLGFTSIGYAARLFWPDGRTPIEMAVQRVMRDPASPP